MVGGGLCSYVGSRGGGRCGLYVYVVLAMRGNVCMHGMLVVRHW